MNFSLEKNKMPSICLALIHNNNEARNSLIRPNIEALAKSLRVFYQVETIEASWQPKIIPDSSYRLLKKGLIFKLLEHQWSKYRMLPGSSIWKLLNSIFQFLKKYAMEDQSSLDRQKS